MKLKSPLILVLLYISFTLPSFAQQDLKSIISQKIDKAKTNNLAFEVGSVTNFHLNTNISSAGLAPDPTMAIPTLSIDMTVTANLNTTVTYATIYFVSDSVLYHPPLYTTANKTIYIEYPLSYYTVVKDMLYNAFYDADNARRKLDIFWVDDGNGKSSAGFFQE